MKPLPAPSEVVTKTRLERLIFTNSDEVSAVAGDTGFVAEIGAGGGEDGAGLAGGAVLTRASNSTRERSAYQPVPVTCLP